MRQLLNNLVIILVSLALMHSRVASYTRRLCARPILAGLSSAIRSQAPSSAHQPFSTRATSFRTNPIFSSRPFSVVAHANVTESVNATSADIVQRLAKLVNFNLEGKHDDNERLIRYVMGMFHRKKPVPKEFIATLLDHAIAVQRQLPNVLSVNRTTLADNADPAHEVTYTSNLTVAGDVHGQYADFAQIFEDSELGGYPSSSNQFIFNGDLVDRGSMALEIVTTLLLAKLLAPSSIHILRGNHETRAMSEHYGFAVEVKRKYDKELLDQFQQFFDTLPIAAVVENSVFVVHGGIGPQCVNMTVAEINELDRFSEPEHASVISEFLWSDPKDKIAGFRMNGARGGGTVCFGANVTEAFLARNNLQLLIRSHEVAMHGYEVLHNGLCVTVFSAPNYCGNTGNYAAVVKFADPRSMKALVHQFAPAGYVMPKKTDAADGAKHPSQ